MPRARRTIQWFYPYHITMRSINRSDFGYSTQELWEFSCDLLLFCSYAFHVEIQSFVLMDNHYHMIVNTPNANLPQFMSYFNREISREIEFKTGRINQKFGARYHSSVIKDLRYYHNVYKYVYRNPVAAGLSNSVESYPYSSLQFIAGYQKYRFPVFDTYFDSVDSYEPVMKWLNFSFDADQQQKIRTALKMQFFSFSD